MCPKEFVLEPSLAKERARNRTAENQRIKDYACTNRDVTWSPSGMNFNLHLHDSGIGSRTGTNSIRNDFTFVLGSCKHCALKGRVRRKGMKKPERAHPGLKFNRVSCKHT